MINNYKISLTLLLKLNKTKLNAINRAATLILGTIDDEILKSNKRTAGISILFVTAISKEQQYVLKGYETGAVDYLFKPLDVDITTAKVKTFLQLYYQQNELQQQNIMLENLSGLVDNSMDITCIFDLGFFPI